MFIMIGRTTYKARAQKPLGEREERKWKMQNNRFLTVSPRVCRRDVASSLSKEIEVVSSRAHKERLCRMLLD